MLDSEGDEGAAGRSANTWSLAMGQLLGVDVEILDAAGEAGEVGLLKDIDAAVPCSLTARIPP